jgi:hypothetical protein
MAFWPDICVELTAKYAQALEAGRFTECWLLSPAGRIAVFLVVEAIVRAYTASELCAVTSRLEAMAQVSAPPAVSASVGHPSLLAVSHPAGSHGAVSGSYRAVSVPTPPTQATSLGSVSGNAFGSVSGSAPAAPRIPPPLPAKFSGVTSDTPRQCLTDYTT